jgi:hypothetical protein
MCDDWWLGVRDQSLTPTSVLIKLDLTKYTHNYIIPTHMTTPKLKTSQSHL